VRTTRQPALLGDTRAVLVLEQRQNYPFGY